MNRRFSLIGAAVGAAALVTGGIMAMAHYSFGETTQGRRTQKEPAR
jgi:hypothetical protein